MCDSTSVEICVSSSIEMIKRNFFPIIQVNTFTNKYFVIAISITQPQDLASIYFNLSRLKFRKLLRNCNKPYIQQIARINCKACPMYKWKFILNSDVVKDIETIIKLNQLLKFVFCGWITFWEWIRNTKYWCDVWMKGNVSLIKGEMVWVKLQSNYCFSNNQIFIFPRLHTGIVILSLYSQP